MKKKKSSGDKNKNISGHEQELLRLHMTMMKHRLRIKLLRTLVNQKLATWDVFHFAKGQADLRNNKKTPDWATIESAMMAKIYDLKIVLKKSLFLLPKLRLELLEKFGGRKYKMGMCIRQIKTTVQKEKNRIWDKYKKKVAHYRKHQITPSEVIDTELKKPFKPTIPLSELSDFSDLSIFGEPKDLPAPVRPLGPFICDKSIQLTRDEFEVLSKEPKFCLGYEPSDTEFRTELERMLAKQRYDEVKKKSNKKKDITASRQDMDPTDPIDSIKDSKKLSERERIDRLQREFTETKDRLVYNPFEKKVNFNRRKPTDYRFNKNVKLPGPMSSNKEFENEIKKREFLTAFHKYKKIVNGKGKITIKPLKKRRQIINLEKRLVEGVQSLSEKVKNGEIFITSTDKSSRFALLNRKQYLESGSTHTSKDRRVDWNEIKYLQSQINSHMWWLLNIVGYSRDNDQKRMNRNILGSTVEVPEMVLLIKDHKAWSPDEDSTVPSRPVVSGSKGINTHLSEFISEFLEPIVVELNSGEISSTEEALARIDKLNDDIRCNLDTPHDDVLDLLRPMDDLGIAEQSGLPFVFNSGATTFYNSTPEQLQTTDSQCNKLPGYRQVYQNLNDSDEITIDTLADLASNTGIERENNEDCTKLMADSHENINKSFSDKSIHLLEQGGVTIGVEVAKSDFRPEVANSDFKPELARGDIRSFFDRLNQPERCKERRINELERVVKNKRKVGGSKSDNGRVTFNT